jgi:capsular polysaccharide transport system permease protein
VTEVSADQTEETPLAEALAIQWRVIQALLLRELISSFGRNNIGFLWMFISPALFVGGFAAIHALILDGARETVPMVPFFLTGWSAMLLWRGMFSKCSGAVGANRGLLYHRNVTVYDLFFARMLLEGASVTVAFIGLMTATVSFGLIAMPHDVLGMIQGWFLLYWFGVGFALVMAVLMDRYSLIKNLNRLISISLLVLSGAFFMVDWLPTQVQAQVLWIPMVHGTEMIRGAYFGPMVTAHFSVAYLSTVNLLLLFSGLKMVDRRKHVMGSDD